MRKHSLIVTVIGLLAFGVADLYGQATATATLQGTVMDKTQAVVPNAEVRITNKDTGAVRTATTGGAGLYRFDLLAAGTYEVQITMPGFATAVYQNVVLGVGRTTTVDVTLEPSAQKQTVTVEASGVGMIDLQKTDVSRPVSPTEVVEMPSNTRDFAALAVLAPGARPVASYDPTKNRIGVFAVNGSNGRNVNVTVNGIDNKDGTVGGPVMQLPLEAIQEFNISTQRFSAANGRSEGAAINVITKSGTNDFHGSLFYQDRRDAFMANDYFSKQGGQPKPPFLRQQFGGSVGGPVKKDKAFLFFALEREREDTSFPVTPTAYSELQLVTSLGAQPTQTIGTPYYDWRYNGRFDYRINDKHNLSLSYSNQHNNGLNDQANATMDLTESNFTTNQLILASASLDSVLTPSVVNIATMGYQYWNNLIDSSLRVPLYSFPDASFGTNGNVPQQSFQKKWQFKDDVAITHGQHTFKMGLDYLYEPLLGGFFIYNATPNPTFFDDPSVILSNKTLYPQGFATPGAIQSIYLTSGNPYFYINGAKMLGLYFQDDWKVSRRLSLSLGLRWDRDFNLNGGAQQAQNRTYLALKAIGSPYAGALPHDDTKDFSPRIGIAYDLTGSGKHVIRAGYGLYYGQTFINIPLFMLQQANATLFNQFGYVNSANPGGACNSLVSDTLPSGQLVCAFRVGVDPMPSAPPVLTQLSTGVLGRMVDPDYRNPYTQQWNAGYTWALTNNSAIEVEYIHVLSLHESKRLTPNPKINGVRNTDAPFKAAGLPLIGRIIDEASVGRSRYDAMNISYRKRMSNHFTVNASYVLSRALGYEGSAANFGNYPTDVLNVFAAHDLGPAPNDETHRFVVSGIVDLPGGIRFAPIMQWASARAYQAAEGISDVFGYGGGTTATQAIVLDSDPTNLLATKGYSTAQLQACLAANTCREVGYDNLRGLPFFELDARFSKELKFKERMRLELFFQTFDLTNRANFGNNYGGNIRTSTFQKPLGFITPTGIIIPNNFAGEFGARFSF